MSSRVGTSALPVVRTRRTVFRDPSRVRDIKRTPCPFLLSSRMAIRVSLSRISYLLFRKGHCGVAGAPDGPADRRRHTDIRIVRARGHETRVRATERTRRGVHVARDSDLRPCPCERLVRTQQEQRLLRDPRAFLGVATAAPGP